METLATDRQFANGASQILCKDLLLGLAQHVFEVPLTRKQKREKRALVAALEAHAEDICQMLEIPQIASKVSWAIQQRAKRYALSHWANQRVGQMSFSGERALARKTE
jgi:hypothetical protein